jgi:hypothetical protein
MNHVRNFLILDRKINISNVVNSKGVTLILVLAFILAVVVLANIALVIIGSQARFTQHKVGRIQASYAAQAGINYALEKLRLGDWGIGSYCIVTKPDSVCEGVIESITDYDFPIQYPVEINIADEDSDGIFEVSAKAIYTYTN